MRSRAPTSRLMVRGRAFWPPVHPPFLSILRFWVERVNMVFQVRIALDETEGLLPGIPAD
jgi:hypothetical protein